ncbi:hypothetical protein N0V90_003128 [Kalmusia sp. IMI 367209]|nr:hypothetical protein N0V90_003128 [Kalmusia sp. IMI 367209]
MEIIKYLLHFERPRRNSYKPLFDDQNESEKASSQPCLCDSCENPARITASRKRIALQITVSLLMLALWTALVGYYLRRNPRLLYFHALSKNLGDEFPIVPTDFQSDRRFIHADPYDSAFWIPDQNNSENIEVNAWNYYGNSWIWLKKGSQYEIPGGRELIPLYEKDAWMMDYLGYQTAYQHEIHCLGVIKHVLNAYRDGRGVSTAENEHANSHCLEVVRHSVMCHPDLTLAGPKFDAYANEHEPYFGGEKHMCRDQSQVHEFFASRNMGFTRVDENGEQVLKAWAWPLPNDGEAQRW